MENNATTHVVQPAAAVCVKRWTEVAPTVVYLRNLGTTVILLELRIVTGLPRQTHVTTRQMNVCWAVWLDSLVRYTDGSSPHCPSSVCERQDGTCLPECSPDLDICTNGMCIANPISLSYVYSWVFLDCIWEKKNENMLSIQNNETCMNNISPNNKYGSCISSEYHRKQNDRKPNSSFFK